VIRAIELLRTGRFRPLYAGLLCTIDVANDPLAVYDALMALEPPRVDFLLPHATWDDPPPGVAGHDEQYADWLIAIFDRWLTDGRPTSVRTFESIESTLSGGDSLTEALGLAPTTLAVIETDGSYEQVDSLKVTYDGAPATELNIFRDSLDVVAGHPGIVARQQGVAGLSQDCQKCPVVSSCGGGLYAHRFRSGSGFDNPSVFCADLLKLVTHVRGRLPQVPANHAMPDEQFRDLAAGQGSAAAVGQLVNGQRTLRRTLLTALYQTVNRETGVSDDARTSLRAAWAVLATVDAERPDVVRRVLDHPFVRPWAARCLSQLRALRPDEVNPELSSLEVDLGYLGALAASSAVQAGIAAELGVPVVKGVVPFPTLGHLILGSGRPHLAMARLIADGDTVQLQLGEDWWKLAVSDMTRSDADPVLVGVDQRTAEWRTTRVLRAPGVSVALEDGDPYRDCFGSSVASRLTTAEFAAWQLAFTDAWTEMGVRYPGHLPAIKAGLKVLVPLAPLSAQDDTGVAERHAFGAVAVAGPPDPARMGRLIAGAFQQVKLGGILDLYDLYDPDAPDAKLAAELLAEAYTELAVRAKDSIDDAVGQLAALGVLTPLGHRFIAEMLRSSKSCDLSGPIDRR
jgi:uncharacterized protein